LDEAQTLGCLEVDLKKQESFNTVSLVEPVGRCDNYSESRMRNYRFEYWNGKNWFRLTGSETPTRTTIHRMTRVSSQKVRLLFESSQQMPHIAESVCMTNPVKGMVNASGECLGNVRADSVQIVFGAPGTEGVKFGVSL